MASCAFSLATRAGSFEAWLVRSSGSASRSNRHGWSGVQTEQPPVLFLPVASASSALSSALPRSLKSRSVRSELSWHGQAALAAPWSESLSRQAASQQLGSGGLLPQLGMYQYVLSALMISFLRRHRNRQSRLRGRESRSCVAPPLLVDDAVRGDRKPLPRHDLGHAAGDRGPLVRPIDRPDLAAEIRVVRTILDASEIADGRVCAQEWQGCR